MTDKYTGYMCSVCGGRKIGSRVMLSGLSGFRCSYCGDESPYKVNDIEDAVEGKSVYMTIKEAAALLDESVTVAAKSATLSSLEKRPFGRLDATEFEEIVVALDLLSEHSAVTPFLKELLTALHVEAKLRVPIP